MDIESASLNDLALMLRDKTDLSNQKIKDLHEEKLDEYEGLVGKKAAILLIAQDHGVRLTDEMKDQEIDIENIVEGVSDICFEKEIHMVFDKSTWDDGQVRNLIVKDDTGTIKVALWDDYADKVSKQDAKESNVLKLSNAYSKINEYKGERNLEVHTSDSSKVEVVD